MKSNKIVVILGGESSEGSGLAVSYARNINTIYLNSHLYNEFVVRPQFALGAGQTMWVTFKPKAAVTPLKTLLMAARKNTDDVQEIVDGTQATVEKSTYKGWEYFLKLPDAITLWAGEWEFSFSICELPYDVKYKGEVDAADTLPTDAAIGDTYFVSEEAKYYVWNGSAWEVLTVSAVSTSDTGKFVVNASVSAPLGAPADLDIQIMYTQVLDFLQHTEDYLPKVGENGNWWLYTADGYEDSGKRAYGTQAFKTRATLNDAGLTENILLTNIITNGKTPEVGDLLYGAMWDGTNNEGRKGLARITAVTTTTVTANAEGYITGKTGAKGTDGAKGDKGDAGEDGVGIASITSEQIATGTKVIITLTDGTQSEFLVSADNFGTITAIDFPYGEPTLTYDTTEGMHIHGVFRLTAGGSHYDVPFDQEIPLVYGDGLNADVTADGKTVLVKVADNVFRKSGGTITGDVTIGGDLVVQGTTSTVDSTHLRVTDKLILVAKDNTVKLTSPAGLLAPKYDGTHSGALVFDGDGTAYVGDVVLNGNNEINVEKSDLQPLATRGALVNGNLVQWDAVALALQDSGYKATDFAKKEELNDVIEKYGQLLYNEAYETGDEPSIGMVLTLQTNMFNRQDFRVGATFQMIEVVNTSLLYWTALEVVTKNDTEHLCTAKITAVLGGLKGFEARVLTQVQDMLVGKLNKKENTTSYAQAYTKLANGDQTMVNISQGAIVSSLAQRTATGTVKGATATEDTDLVPKGQMDSAIAGVSSYEETTYAALKTKRDGGTLVKGKWYRITDYTCTTTQADTQSAGHAFDIIVRADDTNVLNENAYAALHSGDTYFANCKLEAWQLKYCLDNDTERFAWADSTNGKGVIFYMKDEWDNECPYDFKNIQFKRYKITASTKVPDLVGMWGITGVNAYTVSTTDTQFFYTFAFFDDVASPNVMYDASLEWNRSKPEAGTNGVWGNVIKDTGTRTGGDNYTTVFQLNNIIIYATQSFYDEDDFYGIYGNTFGNGCYSNTFGNGCYSNTFGNGCSSNTFGNGCSSNTFGNDCYYNTFGNGCYSNTFGNGCYSNTFGNGCYYNTFGQSVNNSTTTGVQLQKCFLKDGVQYVQFTNSTEVVVQGVTVDSRIIGASNANKLQLYDADIVNKNYPITITRESGTNGKYLMIWKNNGGCETGKYKTTATAASWTAFTDDMQSTSKGYVDTQVGNIDTLLQQINNGAGV